MSGKRSPPRPSERALGVHGSRGSLRWGGSLSGNRGQEFPGARGQELRPSLEIREPLGEPSMVSGWCRQEDTKTADGPSQRRKSGGRVTGAFGKGLNAYRPVTLHQVHIGTSQGGWPNPGCWVSPPAGQGCSLGISISIRFPGRSPCCWFWVHRER